MCSCIYIGSYDHPFILQKTPKDKKANLVIHGFVDKVSYFFLFYSFSTTLILGLAIRNSEYSYIKENLSLLYGKPPPPNSLSLS